MKTTFSPSGSLARMGLGMQFAAGFEDVEYYARGPWSNYADRKTGSMLGRYQTTVDDMVDEMIHPQTYGDHQDMRSLTLRNNSELGKPLTLNIEAEGQAAFSLGHYDETRWCTWGDSMWNSQLHWYDRPLRLRTAWLGQQLLRRRRLPIAVRGSVMELIHIHPALHTKQLT